MGTPGSSHEGHKHHRPAFIHRLLHRRNLPWPVALLIALAWLLFRSGLRPLRLAYPCQQTALAMVAALAPAWALGASAALAALARRVIQPRVVLTALLGLAGAYGIYCVSQDARAPHPALGYSSQALKSPGTVVHVHSAQATTWDFSTGYYGDYVDQDTVNQMVDRALMALTATNDALTAWQELLPDYRPGQTIAIKVNFNNCWEIRPQGALIDGLIQPVNALARGLVALGVAERDIWVIDAMRYLPARFREGSLYGLRFFDVYGESESEPVTFNSADPDAWVHFSQEEIPDVRLADQLVQADYIIDMPIIKRHQGAYYTLAFKNHIGSMQHVPNPLHGAVYPNGPYYDPNRSPLVELWANPHIGPKTILILGDGLFGDRISNSSTPVPWNTFGHEAPNSIFAATDPVAIDSVMGDIVHDENPGDLRGLDYLHVAALEGWGIHEHCPRTAACSTIDYIYIDLQEQPGPCDDGTCDHGDVCPTLAHTCPDEVCFAPTCEAGCGLVALGPGYQEPGCDGDYACDGQGGCAILAACTDGDNDGFGPAGQTAGCLDERPDCDDTDPLRYPDAPERCNGLDDDCDGLTDEGCECLDGSCDPGDACPDLAATCPDEVCFRPTCEAGCGLVALGLGAQEPGCDGDHACDGLGGCEAQIACSDADHDGFGPPGQTEGCPDERPDCDDTDPLRHPGAPERCNMLDDDCDGEVDERCGCDDGSCDPGDDCPELAHTCPDQPCWHPTCDEGCDMELAPPGSQDEGCLDQSHCNGRGECITGTLCVDQDRDGYGPEGQNIGCPQAGVDCADRNPSRHPGLEEICNGVDDDCDGQVDEGCACQDGECNMGDECPELALTCPHDVCWEPTCSGGCGQVALVLGRQDEACQGADYCDGLGACVASVGCLDQDGDGYGALGAAEGCARQGLDCEDGDHERHPGSPEVCNGVDDDCDGRVDEQCECLDGRCDPGDACPTLAPTCPDAPCLEPTCAAGCGLEALPFGAQDEACLGDDFCDGNGYCLEASVCVDEDGDGYGAIGTTAGCEFQGADCDDMNSDRHPGMEEICNGLDDNCNGAVDEGCECLDGTCDPGDHCPDLALGCPDRVCWGPTCWEGCGLDPLPLGAQEEGCQGDDYCDGDGICVEGVTCVDGDGDGYGALGTTAGCPLAGVDCDDRDPGRHPGAEELCNGIDDDCDNSVDEGCQCLDGSCDPGDACPNLAATCPDEVCWTPTCVDGCGAVAVAEGETDEGCGGHRACDGQGGCLALCGDQDGDGYGPEGATDGCPYSEADCDDLSPARNPGAEEACNGMDDDCDGLIDEGCPGMPDASLDAPFDAFASGDTPPQEDGVLPIDGPVRQDRPLSEVVPATDRRLRDREGQADSEAEGDGEGDVAAAEGDIPVEGDANMPARDDRSALPPVDSGGGDGGGDGCGCSLGGRST